MPEDILQHSTILVTRPAGQAEGFCRMIAEAGGRALLFPVIEIAPLEIREQEIQWLQSWHEFDMALFVSTNAVSQALTYINSSSPSPRIGAVGAKTARLLARSGLKVDLVPEQGFNSEALLALPELQSIEGWRVLLLKGAGGRELLREELERRGAEVIEIALYQRRLPQADPAAVCQQGRNGAIHLVTVTSVESLSNLLTLLASEGRDWLKKIPLLAGSARIAEQARKEGFHKILVATDPGDESMMKAVLQWKKENKA